jgi:hypothetical protein
MIIVTVEFTTGDPNSHAIVFQDDDLPDLLAIKTWLHENEGAKRIGKAVYLHSCPIIGKWSLAPHHPEAWYDLASSLGYIWGLYDHDFLVFAKHGIRRTP